MQGIFLAGDVTHICQMSETVVQVLAPVCSMRLHGALGASFLLPSSTVRSGALLEAISGACACTTSFE